MFAVSDIAAAAGILCLVGYAVLIVPTWWVRVERVRHPAGIGQRIVQVSDLHVEMLRVGPGRLRRLIERERPDLIVLTGDYTQRLKHVPKVDVYLREIGKIGVPVYAVFGNHDYRLKAGVSELFRLFRRHRIPVLRNESMALPGFTLVGIDDWDAGLTRTRQAFRHVDKHGKIVVIAHNPTITLAISHRYDYLMAGHFHGGQFRLPFVFRLKGKGPLANQGIYQGLHRNKQGWFYISKGIGQSGVNVRFLIRSELTVHDL